MESTAVEKTTRIPIFFSPYIKGKEKRYAVEKADDTGQKRRYLTGSSSGSKFDAHSERMTDKCIKSFMEQANSGNILLYADIHGIKSSEDIGILVKAEILPDGDWYTEYRLYDEFDPVDDISKQRADKVWRQINGFEPYKKPIQKGFSIEGNIPEGGLVSAQKDESGNMTNRVIDEILLDGVVLVPRPAYASVATACYKALGEMTPRHVDKVEKVAQGVFKSIFEGQQMNDQYYKMRWEINDALDKAVEKTMKGSRPEKEQELHIVFKEYANAIIPLVLKSASLFQDKDDEQISEPPEMKVGKASKLEVYKALLSELEKLRKSF